MNFIKSTILFLYKNLPKTAFIIFPSGAFGGAEKRFTNLFLYFSAVYPNKFHYIINPLMQKHLLRAFPEINGENIHVVNTGADTMIKTSSIDSPSEFKDNVPDMIEVDKNTSLVRKLYWYNKNKILQRQIFKQIEKIRIENDIKVLIGIFAGGLPLVFYKEKNIPDVKIIFSDMDSWFSDILPDKKKLWYRKYFSFNYILENADMIDFLSPYIHDGIKKIGVNIPFEKVSVAPCSFIEYSKCPAACKDNIEIAFAGRLEPDKNPLLYLEAASEIIKIFPLIKFHLLGEGTLVTQIKEFINNNGLSGNVNFVFHNNPPEIFSQTSIFVSLQSGTNYPSQSVLEAMACGNAIIASDTGDTRLFINNSNGLLVPLNKESVVIALKMLITDKQKTKLLGANARKYAIENHTIEKVSNYYLGLIKSVYGESKIG